MYLTIQKRSNFIIMLAFIVTAIVLYGISYFISAYTELGIIVTIICFACVILVVHLFLSVLIKNLENLIIFRMIDKKQIALAKVKPGNPHKHSRDIFFTNHEIYSFETEVYTQDGEKKNVTIYEDVKSSDFSSLPAYVYVTYNGRQNKIGIVPTFYIYLKPKLKDIVQKYEKQYKPHYVEAVKHKGLTLKSFKS